MISSPVRSGAVVSSSIAGMCSIASGIIGLVSFAALVVYLVTQEAQFAATGVMPQTGRVLLDINFLGVALQALCMIPIVVALQDRAGHSPVQLSQWTMKLCVAALFTVIVVRLLIFVSPSVSDILFMGPMGFVGVWLIAANWFLKGSLSLGLRILGMIAGAGLTVVGLNFFFNGGMAVFTHGPMAYANDVPFHQGLAIGGFPGFILFPVWAIWAGIRLIRFRPG